MKLRSLEVSDFRRIRRAKLELGPGLNVVYGPNDLGKSTLVEALRAALLLPSTSTVANDYVPWDRDATPAVALELEHRGVLYCVKKSWGTGTRATALLERADDGHTFAVDAKSREVDGKLRELFQWGIASPGGKQAPRGLPESFLTSVLFGTQAESDALFGASLDKDTDEAGRLRLTDALEAYAQDPVLKEILERAQKKVDEAFSATGQKRKGKASPFREPGEAVKEAQRELQRAEERLEEAERAQDEAERLREALAHATARRDEAREALAEAERDAEATERRSSAERALAEARQTLADFEADAARARALADELKALDERVAARRAALDAASKAEREARDAHDAAKATLRDVRGADAEREMRLWELERAWDDAVVAANRAKQARAKAAEAEEARAKAERSAAKVEAAAAALADAERAVVEARTTAEAVDAALARRERDVLQRRVDSLAEEVAALEALRASLVALETRLAAPLEEAPSAEALDALRRLASMRAVAEAKLAVGLSLALRKLGEATVEASADGAPVDVAGRTLALDATRELRVKVGHAGGPLVELVVTGGAAEAREEAEAASTRWRAEASALGLDPELPPDEALDVLGVAVEAGLARRREREEAERELVAERERLGRGQRAKEEHDATRARLEAMAEPQLSAAVAAKVATLGDVSEAQRDEAKRALEKARADVDAARATHAQLSSTAQVDAREAELKATEAPNPDEDLDTLQSRAEAAGKLVEEFKAASGQVSRSAEEKVARAKDALDAAELAVSMARRDADASAQERAATEARLEELRRNLARSDGDALTAAVKAREEALAAAPMPSRPVDAASLREARDAFADAERATTEARERHLRFLGQVEASEGAVAVERHREAREAFELARAREHEIEVDFGAWRLLRDALRDAENAEGHHLGEALAPKVAARLADLARHAETPARYAGLRLDAHLRTEGVLTSGEARDPKQLSVGTREQIALLLRLAVAEILQLPLVLDDHLTHTDPARARWFRDTLRAAAHDTQILVLTCHPDVYLDDADRPSGERTHLDRAAGLLRAIDATRVVSS